MEENMAKYNRVLLKLSGEALAGEKVQAWMRQPVSQGCKADQEAGRRGNPGGHRDWRR